MYIPTIYTIAGIYIKKLPDKSGFMLSLTQQCQNVIVNAFAKKSTSTKIAIFNFLVQYNN